MFELQLSCRAQRATNCGPSHWTERVIHHSNERTAAHASISGWLKTEMKVMDERDYQLQAHLDAPQTRTDTVNVSTKRTTVPRKHPLPSSFTQKTNFSYACSRHRRRTCGQGYVIWVSSNLPTSWRAQACLQRPDGSRVVSVYQKMLTETRFQWYRMNISASCSGRE